MPAPAVSVTRSPGRDDGVVLRTVEERVDALEVRVQALRELVVAGQQLEALVLGHDRAVDALDRREPRLGEQESQIVRVHRPDVIGIDPERVCIRVQRHRIHRLHHDAPARPHLLGREPHDVDDVLRRQVLDDLDHHEAAETRVRERLEILDGAAHLDVEALRARQRDQLGFGLDPARLDAELREQPQELSSAEADVEHRTASGEAGGQIAVALGDVVGVAAEVRVERVGVVPRIESRSRYPRDDLLEAREHALHAGVLLGELRLQVVELLEHALVVDVGDHVRRAHDQRDRAGDALRLLLRLVEHALHLAADALRERAVHQRTAGDPTAVVQLAPVELVRRDRLERLVELVQEKSGRRGAVAGQAPDVLLEIAFESRWIRAVEAATLDAIAERREQLLEIRGLLRRLRIGRGRRLLVGHAPNVPCARISTRTVDAIDRDSVDPVVNDRPADPLPYADVRAEIEADAGRASGSGANAEYLDRIRSETDRFTLRTAASDDIRAAIALLEEQTDVQASAPVDSRNRGISAAKVVVRKTVFFAVNHLAEQMRALGWAAASVGEAAAERIETLEP